MTLIAIRSFNGHEQWLSDHEPTPGSCRVPAPMRDTRYRCEDGHLWVCATQHQTTTTTRGRANRRKLLTWVLHDGGKPWHGVTAVLAHHPVWRGVHGGEHPATHLRHLAGQPVKIHPSGPLDLEALDGNIRVGPPDSTEPAGYVTADSVTLVEVGAHLTDHPDSHLDMSWVTTEAIRW